MSGRLASELAMVAVEGKGRATSACERFAREDAKNGIYAYMTRLSVVRQLSGSEQCNAQCRMLNAQCSRLNAQRVKLLSG